MDSEWKIECLCVLTSVNSYQIRNSRVNTEITNVCPSDGTWALNTRLEPEGFAAELFVLSLAAQLGDAWLFVLLLMCV